MSFRLAPKLSITLAAAAVAATLPLGAQAATANATVNAQAQVNSQCNLLTSNVSMDFGVVDVLATGSATANPTLQITCNKGATVSLTANAGANASGAQKRMKNGSNADTLSYSILQASGAGFSTCPATIAGGTELAGTAMPVSSLWASSGGPASVTLCGRLETPQITASPGTYTDVVTVTVTY